MHPPAPGLPSSHWNSQFIVGDSPHFERAIVYSQKLSLVESMTCSLLPVSARQLSTRYGVSFTTSRLCLYDLHVKSPISPAAKISSTQIPWYAKKPPEDNFPALTHTDHRVLAIHALLSFLKWDCSCLPQGLCTYNSPDLGDQLSQFPGTEELPFCGISRAKTRKVWTKQNNVTTLPARRTVPLLSSLHSANKLALLLAPSWSVTSSRKPFLTTWTRWEDAACQNTFTYLQSIYLSF